MDWAPETSGRMEVTATALGVPEDGDQSEEVGLHSQIEEDAVIQDVASFPHNIGNRAPLSATEVAPVGADAHWTDFTRAESPELEGFGVYFAMSMYGSAMTRTVETHQLFHPSIHLPRRALRRARTTLQCSWQTLEARSATLSATTISARGALEATIWPDTRKTADAESTSQSDAESPPALETSFLVWRKAQD
ncbi:hypothetical protein BDZ89DRAFT_1041930 [Hymenopellis radicata]|nr:hypothetical protein BDZ89DRAFT_1041930 [Hymenopellis radicata]